MVEISLTRVQEKALIQYALEHMLEAGMEAEIDKEIALMGTGKVVKIPVQ